MSLPEIKLPNIDLPFDIPVLLHPPVDHFAIALPVVILLLEFYNLFAKRRSIGVFSFILLILTVVVFAAAYLTGSTDGKEAFDFLSPEGQEALKEHKLLGTYLMLGSAVLLFFKLLASTGKGFLKALFFLVLIGFIAVLFEQGEDGGKLVYEYGANVERVKTMDDEIFDLKEELEEAQDAQKAETPEATEGTSEESSTTEDVAPEPAVKEETAVSTVESVKAEPIAESTKKVIQDAAEEMKNNEQVKAAGQAIEELNETLPMPVQ